jgi:hypothetical protein
LLLICIREDFRIFFTTRDSYLDDLNYLFLEIYGLFPLHIRVNSLTDEELVSISNDYMFKLPNDDKLLEVIRIPFYLNEYLKFYTDMQELNYAKFKDALWNKTIKNGNYEREQCFLRIAHDCAKKGVLFTDINSFGLEMDLVKDGILGKEGTYYFIAHDIHEEWALEKIIDSSFITRHSIESFFENIGNSLPIRRSFRSWLSDRLLETNSDAIKLIEYTILSEQIDNFWKDEIMVSVLLSNYSFVFFDVFNQKLKDNNLALLIRIAFLLQVACKEIDYSYFSELGNRKSDLLKMEYVLTMPKGNGWESFIKFIYDNLSSIFPSNDMGFLMPIIFDWSKNHKRGKQHVMQL